MSNNKIAHSKIYNKLFKLLYSKQSNERNFMN